MLCAISGEAPQHPVTSRKSGHVFERRLIELYISENGTDPVTGETLTPDDLIDLKQTRLVKPRPPTLTSIPALLSTFQNEWDAIVLESFQLRQQLSETRQELSAALYYNEAAQRVIARLQGERDEAREALSRVQVTGGAGRAVNGSNGDAMQVNATQQGLSEGVLARIEETQQRLSATRRKRPVPEDWATGEQVQSYEVKDTVETHFTGAKMLALDETGEFFLCGDSDGSMAVYDLKQKTFTTRSNLSAGAVLAGAWCRDKTCVGTASGTVAVAVEGGVQAKFQLHAGAATAVAGHPCGDLLASVGVDKSYVLYDLQSGKVLTQVFTESELTTVAFHPDGHLLAAGTSTGSILLYDVKTSALAHTFQPTSPSSPVQSLSFSENGTWLASAPHSQTVGTIWDLRKLTQLTTLDIGTPVTALAWDYTGQFFAACGKGAVVVSWYDKKAKAWSEPLRKGIEGVSVGWGAKARSLVVLNGEGAVIVFSG